jgi:CheY-like chemotaxis protein
MKISKDNFNDRIVRQLAKVNIFDTETLAALTADEVLSIKGLGKISVLRLDCILNDLELPRDNTFEAVNKLYNDEITNIIDDINRYHWCVSSSGC